MKSGIISFFRSLFSSRRERLLWLALLLLGFASMADIPGSAVFNFSLPLQWLAVSLIAAFKATAFLLVFHLAYPVKWLRIFVWCLVACFAFLSLVNAVSFSLYGFGLTHKLFIVLQQTNLDETLEYTPSILLNILSFLLSWKFWVGLLVLVAAGFAVCRVPARLLRWVSLVSGAVGLVVFVFIWLCFTNGKSSFMLSMRVPKYVREIVNDQRLLAEYTAKIDTNVVHYDVVSEHRAATVVLVIGESASRGHLSLYGYPLPTTPEMDAMRDSLFIFTDAIGSAVITADNMNRILTFKPDDAEVGNWWKYPILIDVMKSAGYKCFWISNQERAGVFGNSSGAMAEHADVMNYVSGDFEKNILEKKYDEALVPALAEALRDSASFKFVGMHLMGSHFNYHQRYPYTHAVFSAEDVRKAERNSPRPWMNGEKYQKVATYDNSIRYSDFVVSEMFREVAALSSPAVIIYISDHGEDVFDDRDFVGRDERFVEVPFIVYPNCAYRKANPDIISALQKSLSKKISTANIPDNLMSITGTVFDQYHPQNDFLNPAFRNRPRFVDESIWKYDR